jgi:isoleucyl-tRNA synthetase
MRREKILGSSLEAVVHFPFGGLNISAEEFAELCIVSEAVDGQHAHIERTSRNKCGRCWRYLPEVTEDGALCDRCEEFVDA